MLFAAGTVAAGDNAVAPPAVTACEGKCTFQDLLVGVAAKLRTGRFQDEPAGSGQVESAASGARSASQPEASERPGAKRRRLARRKPAMRDEEGRRGHVVGVARPIFPRGFWRPRFAAAREPRKAMVVVPRRYRYAALWPAARPVTAAAARVITPSAGSNPRTTKSSSPTTSAPPAVSASPTLSKARIDPAAATQGSGSSPYGGLDIR